MTTTKKSAFKDLFIEALSLPGRSRAALAQRLLISLEHDEATSEIEAAWDREAERRYRAFKRGRMKERSSADVLRDAYARIK